MRWGVRRVAALALAIAALAVGCGGPPVRTGAEVALEGRLAAGGEAAFAAAVVPYRVHQAEFQRGDGDLVWVFQVDDTAEAVWRAQAFDVDDAVATFDAPLSAYAGALAPHWEELDGLGVDVYILSFAGPDRLVYEVSPAVMGDLVAGRRNPPQVRDDILISAHTRR